VYPRNSSPLLALLAMEPSIARADNTAEERSCRIQQGDSIENQGYAIMCSPIQNPRPPPIIPKLLSFRLAILGQYLPFHAWFLAKEAQRSGFLHGRATTH